MTDRGRSGGLAIEVSVSVRCFLPPVASTEEKPERDITKRALTALETMGRLFTAFSNCT